MQQYTQTQNEVFDSDNNMGYIDALGNEIIPIGKYESLGSFENGYMTLQLQDPDDWDNTRNIVIDSTGAEVYNENFREGDIFSGVSAEGLMVVYKNQRAGVIDLNKWVGE